MNASDTPELQPRPRTYRLLAILALVFSIIPLTAILGLIAGITSLVLTKKRPAQFGGRRLATAAVIISVLWFIAIPSAFYYGMTRMRREFYSGNSCQMHARSLASSLMIISIANSGTYPDAANWCEAIGKEVTSKEHYQCPDDPLHGQCGFAYNAKLSGFKDPDPRTVMIFESDLGWNGSGGASNAVAKPRHNGWAMRVPRGTNAPVARRSGNYHRGPFVMVGFADRSVAPIAIEDLPNLRWDP